MRTPRRALLIPAGAVVALALAIAGCSSGGSDSSDTTGTVATTNAVATTASPTTTSTSPTTTAVATTQAPTTQAPSTAAPTTSAPDLPVDGGGVEIIVQVGVDDAATTGGRVERVPLGSAVTLRLIDESGAQEYHVHGFDLEQSVTAGTEAVFEFTADQAGTFEVESHTSEKVLLVLEVA